MEVAVSKKGRSGQTKGKAGKKKGEIISLQPSVRNQYKRQFERIVRKIREYSKNPDIELLRHAYKFTYDAHKNHFRKSGKLYIEHCIETANILVDLRMDVVTLAAGLLHDVVEDAEVSIEEIQELFGEETAQLVDGVTKISELKFQSQAEKQAENFRKMIFSMAMDLRVIMIKFADRLHNMRTIQFLPIEKAERIALALKREEPLMRVVAVSASNARVMHESLEAGHPITFPEAETIASALSGGIDLNNRYTFRLVRDLVDEYLLVSEDEIRRAMAFAATEHKLVVEGGGAVGIAALLSGRFSGTGEITAVVVSGGNIETGLLADVVASCMDHQPGRED